MFPMIIEISFHMLNPFIIDLLTYWVDYVNRIETKQNLYPTYIQVTNEYNIV